MNFKLWLEGIMESIHINLPDGRQRYDYDCGCTDLFVIAQYYGVGPVDQEDYINMFKKNGRRPYGGTHPKDIVVEAKKLGLHAEFHNNVTIHQLKEWVDAKKPVMVEIQAYGKKSEYHKLNDGHYVIAIGYDKDRIIFEDPSLKDTRGFIPTEEFEERWQERETNGDKWFHSAIVFWMVPNTPKHPYELHKVTYIP